MTKKTNQIFTELQVICDQRRMFDCLEYKIDVHLSPNIVEQEYELDKLCKEVRDERLGIGFVSNDGTRHFYL